MYKTIYAENTILHRKIDENESNDFQKIIKKRQLLKNRKGRYKKNNIIDYKKKLFNSNNRQFIMMANGLQTNISKGSDNEWMFWHVKDSTESPGNNYYFDSPEDAERIFKSQYPVKLKEKWHERVVKYRDDDDDDDDESTINEVTIVK